MDAGGARMTFPLQVVHIIAGLEVGGAEMTLCRLLPALRERQISGSVITLTDGGPLGKQLVAKGIPVFPMGMPSGRPSLPGVWRLLGMLRQLRPQVIQGWLYQGNLAALAGQRLALPGAPLVWNIRHSLDDLSHEKKGIARVIAMGRRFSGLASTIIYNSARSAKQHQAYGYAADRSVVIPNGFDGTIFHPAPEARERTRRELGLEPDQIAIGLVARYHPVKGHAEFFQAVAPVMADFPSVRLVLAGRGIDAGNRELLGLIARQGLTERVLLTGERRDLPEFWPALDIAALSSHAEAFPNILGEAMASGVPCVTTDVGDAAMIVGASGRVVPPRDPSAMATALREIIAMGAESRRALGREARRRVLENFAFAGTVARYEELYHSLCQPLDDGAR